MEKAVCLSFPLFSREIPYSTLPQKNQRYMNEEQLQRGQCSLGLEDSWVSMATHMSNSQIGNKSRDLRLLHEDLKNRAGPQLQPFLTELRTLRVTIKRLISFFCFKKILLGDVESIAELFLPHHPLGEVSRN